MFLAPGCGECPEPVLVVGAGGNDKMAGGADADVVISQDGVAESQISCGSGADHLIADNTDTVLDASCELISI